MPQASKPVPPSPPPPPANVYSGVYRALLWGMAASTVLFALGLLRTLLDPPYISLDPAWMRSRYHWHGLLGGLVHLDSASLLLVATVVLIFTPVARVAVAMAAFWIDRDYRYVAVTGAVLAVIALTVILGRLGLH